MHTAYRAEHLDTATLTPVPSEQPAAVGLTRLLVTITRYWPAIGGAELHTRELLRNFGSDVRPVVVAHWLENRTDWLLGTTLLGPRTTGDYVDEGRPVRTLRATPAQRLAALPWTLGYYPLMPLAAHRLARGLVGQLAEAAGEVDVVHNVRIGREPLSLASLKLAHSRGVPFVLTPNHHPRWRGWRYHVFHDLYRRADAVIALTGAERDMLVAVGTDPRRVHVTGIGPVLALSASPERVRARHGLPERFVLFLGQKHAYKGFEAVLAAAPAVWQRHPDVRFVFVGPRTQHSEAVFARVDDPRVIELGAVELQEKTDLLAACSAVCVPSSQESFGGVIVEAWASAKPVVAGPAPAAAELIAEGEDGLFVPEQSAGPIAERLSWLLDDGARAAAMGAAGARKVAERFTWPRLAEQTASIYRSLG